MCSILQLEPLSVWTYFQDSKEPRVERTRRHNLMDIVVIRVMAVIAYADGWDDIAAFAKERQAWLRTFLELPHGISCADTFRRVFTALDPDAFQGCFMNWVRRLDAMMACEDREAMANGCDGNRQRWGVSGRHIARNEATTRDLRIYGSGHPQLVEPACVLDHDGGNHEVSWTRCSLEIDGLEHSRQPRGGRARQDRYDRA
jgi:hypothetical protein